MNWTIHKQVIDITDTQTIVVPNRAAFLAAQVQGRDLCIWYLCDPNETTVVRAICVVGTGHDASRVKGMRYLSTFQIYDGALVFHVFVED
jgi:hypothetical protein